MDLMKKAGTFGTGIVELRLGFAVVIGLTALLYIIFWVCLSKSLHVIASPQCSPNPTQYAAYSSLSDGKC